VDRMALMKSIARQRPKDGRRWLKLHSSFKSIELDSYIQVGSYEVPLKGVHDIYLDPAAPHIAEVEEAVMSMAITKSLGQSMPLQCQLAALKLDALVHVVICNQLPLLELH